MDGGTDVWYGVYTELWMEEQMCGMVSTLSDGWRGICVV